MQLHNPTTLRSSFCYVIQRLALITYITVLWLFSEFICAKSLSREKKRGGHLAQWRTSDASRNNKSRIDFLRIAARSFL